jgi:hypothetical protein
MKLSAHQLNYLPYPGLIAKINLSDVFIYLTKVQFEKKSWQSRNKIICKNSSLLLSVPIKDKNKIHNIDEVKINNESKWSKKHLANIVNNYKKSTYYEKYINFFEDLYSKSWDKLEDLNIHILKYLIKELNIKTKIISDKEYNFKGKKNELLLEMCETIGSNTYISNLGSQNYINLKLFEKKKINHFFINYKNYNYKQYNNTFVPNLSIFDMLFFCGPQKTEEIIKSKKNIDISKNFLKL